MRSLVIYESMFGNTHRIADAIGAGLAEAGDVSVVPVDSVKLAAIRKADLVVIGGPTHVHGMSNGRSRDAAIEQASTKENLTLDAEASGNGLRPWFESLGQLDGASAAFDTRVKMPAALSGRASKHISKESRRRGLREVAPPESFFVDKSTELLPGEEERATAWGRDLAETVVSTAGG